MLSTFWHRKPVPHFFVLRHISSTPVEQSLPCFLTVFFAWTSSYLHHFVHIEMHLWDQMSSPLSPCMLQSLQLALLVMPHQFLACMIFASFHQCMLSPLLIHISFLWWPSPMQWPFISLLLLVHCHLKSGMPLIGVVGTIVTCLFLFPTSIDIVNCWYYIFVNLSIIICIHHRMHIACTSGLELSDSPQSPYIGATYIIFFLVIDVMVSHFIMSFIFIFQIVFCPIAFSSLGSVSFHVGCALLYGCKDTLSYMLLAVQSSLERTPPLWNLSHSSLFREVPTFYLTSDSPSK